MNSFQRLGTFLSRLLGCLVALVGIAGPFHYGAAKMIASGLDYSMDRFLGSFLWALAGVLLVVFSRRIGGLIGQGLD